MKSEYYRVRVSFNTQVERDQMCIAYLQRRPNKQYELIRDLIYEGILAREAGEGAAEKEELINRLKDELAEKDRRIKSLMQEIGSGDATYYDMTLEDVNESGKRKCSRKNPKSGSSKKYKAEEKVLNPPMSLKELILSADIDPGAMNMLSVAIETGVEEKLIRSMIMNKKSAKEIRSMIEVIQALERRADTGKEG